MEYTTAPGFSARTPFTFAITPELNPPHSEALDDMATIASGASSATWTSGSLAPALRSVSRIPSICLWYGRIASIASCARLNFDDDTSFIADVIFSVLRTDPIRLFISLSVGIT